MKKNNVDELILKLKKELDNSSLIKEYRNLKSEIENNEELNEIALRLKMSAKLSQDKTEFLALKAQYENHPLIVNYKEVEQQVNDLLIMLKDILKV